MVKCKLFICLIFSILLLSCNNRNKSNGSGSDDMRVFTYKFSMESMGNYKVEFQLNPDTTYKIQQQNLFFDRYAGTSNPKKIEGVLSPDEFDRFNKLVRESDLQGMDDSYGFDDDSESPMMYIIELREGDNVKYVSINPEVPQYFSEEFNDLIGYTTKFMDSKLVD